MIRQKFIINLRGALKHNQESFNSVYNKEVMNLIPLLMELNIILNVSKNDLVKNDRIIVYLNTKSKPTIKSSVKNMCSRKKIRSWPVSVLIKNAQRNNIYILKTVYGYKDSSFCIKNRIGGVTILKIEC